MINLTLKIKKFVFVAIILFTSNLMAQEGTITINQDNEINKLLVLKKDVETSSERFKIQIFSGAGRSNAEKARSKFLETYADIESNIEYQTPNYKIWVGNFRSSLEADRALMRIKKTFPNAFIFKPKKNND